MPQDNSATAAGGRVVEIVLAVLLFLAASLKAFSLFASSGSPISGLIQQRILLICLIEAELLLAIWLLVGGASRLRFLCAIACFCLFAAAAAYEFFHAMPSCGCFGNVKVSPAVAAVLDVAAVIALWTTRASRATWKSDRPPPRRLLAGYSAASVLTAALWTAYLLEPAHAATALVVLDPDTWPNRPFPLLDEIDGSAPLRDGRWLVILYHFDCSDCRAAIPAYEALADRVHIAFVAMPPLGPSPVADSPAYLSLTLRPDHEWFATTPLVAALQDGSVVSAEGGDNAVHPSDLQLLFSPHAAR
jgi:hypothetical protein